MEFNKPLARAGYFLALLLVVFPLYDATTSVWPPHLGDERWRFGAIGALSNLMLVPLLGFLIALAVATFADDRRVRRVLGWICAILALGTAVLAVLFILDYFQTRNIVRPQFQQAMGVATTTAMIKHACTIITLLLLSRVGFAGPKAVVRRNRAVTEPSAPSPLLPLGGATRVE